MVRCALDPNGGWGARVSRLSVLARASRGPASVPRRPSNHRRRVSTLHQGASVSQTFGRRDELALELSPLQPSWERRFGPEKSTWAALSIWLGGRNLAEHTEPESNQLEQALNVPLAAIADWFVRAWPCLALEERSALFPTTETPQRDVDRWADTPPVQGVDEDTWLNAREEWWNRHFWASGTDGIWLPDIAFVRQDDYLVVEWRERTRPSGAPRWTHGAGSELIRWKFADEAIAEFVQFVSDWLRDEGLVDLYWWCAVANPLEAARPDLPTSIELFTAKSKEDLARLFATEEPALLAERLGLSSMAVDPSDSPLTQALRDLPRGLPKTFASLLEWLRDKTSSGNTVDAARSLREHARAAAVDAPTIEAAGYQAAEATRHRLQLNGEPVSDFSSLLDGLGIASRTFSVVNGARMLVGARMDAGTAIALADGAPSTRSWVRRFEQARALGHLLVDGFRGSALGAASSSYTAGLRHRRSGAFAAEFLMPRDGLLKLTSGFLDAAAEPDVFENLMEHFGVGARSAAYHLWNHRLLSSMEIRDSLIDEFAEKM